MISTDPLPISQQTQGTDLYLWNTAQLPALDPQIFDSNSQALGAKSVTDGGRNAAWFIEINGLPAVLKHYRRGGVMALFNRSYYFWLGQARARSFNEFNIMRKMLQLGLPVPEVVAAACWRKSVFFYRAALITKRIEGAIPLARSVDTEDWFKAGQVVKSMHQHNILHADLNVFNIMIDSDHKVWLIDFDQARSGIISHAENLQSISRFHRSVKKVLHFQTNKFWLQFLMGYSGLPRH
jgi:3-deoxy-D-manno-octulosonic acid kinase